MSATRLVLFDIDGTLLVTCGAGRRAITAAMVEHIGDMTGTEHVRFDGKTDPQIVRELLDARGHPPPHDDAHVQAVCDRYVTLLERELDAMRASAAVMAGVPALLDRLEAEPGVVLGLLTGNLARGAALKLAAAGIDTARFRVGAFGSDAAHRPALPAIAAARAEPFFGRVPRGAEVVIIGDTPADVTCGHAIGARAVAVATGSYSLEELAAHGPDALFADLLDTDAVLGAILA